MEMGRCLSVGFAVLLFSKNSLSNLLLPIHVNSCTDLLHSYSYTHVLTNTKIHVHKRGLAPETRVQHRGKGMAGISFSLCLLGSS